MAGIRQLALKRPAAGPAAGFTKECSGSTAAEFGLIAALFFSIIFGIVEIGMIIFAKNSFELGAWDAVNELRGGETDELSAAATRNAVCEHLVFAICDDLTISVTRHDDMASALADQTEAAVFAAGEPGDIIRVRLALPTRSLISLIIFPRWAGALDTMVSTWFVRRDVYSLSSSLKPWEQNPQHPCFYEQWIHLCEQ